MSEAKTFQECDCKAGDVLICVNSASTQYTVGSEYVVIQKPFDHYLVLLDNYYTDDEPSYRAFTDSTFIKKEEEKMAFDGKQLFGKKYRVNPETSKLIQEAVFAAGGRWQDGSASVKHTDAGKFLFVKEDGCLTTSWSNETTFIDHKYPEGIITVGITGVTVVPAVDKEAEAKKKQLEDLDRKIKELQAIADKLKEEV